VLDLAIGDYGRRGRIFFNRHLDGFARLIFGSDVEAAAASGLGRNVLNPVRRRDGKESLYIRVWNFGRGRQSQRGAGMQNCLRYPSSPAGVNRISIRTWSEWISKERTPRGPKISVPGVPRIV
jgi:hypothetical protein